MQRPTSVASSATAQSCAGTTARLSRTNSEKQSTRPSGSTVISLFVTNLRLLNFDLLPDWPAISNGSFGNQDARNRIRCTEFALFHLFKLYDPTTTADKLQPFFPPLEPLQSINLRAALYRCLNDLKKTGILGKETVLRKTMLDECQGDKFWELCLGFSALVLRKVTLEKRSRYGKPTAEKIGTARSLSKRQRESLLPLAIAHKGSLSKLLDQKQRLHETYARLYDVLVDKEEDLMRRKALAEERRRSRPNHAQVEKLKAVEQHVRRHWAGSDELCESMFTGEGCTSGDDLFDEPVDALAATGEIGGESLRRSGSRGILSSAAETQTQRIHKWQVLHERLLTLKLVDPADKDRRPQDRAEMRFDKHRDLTVRGDIAQNEDEPSHRGDSGAKLARYDEILTSMREQLRRTRSATAPQPSPTKMPSSQPQPPRKPSMNLDSTAGAPNPHQRSPSQTAVPVRPALGHRVSSRSRSYQQPKVESQRQPIPLKSELFSPLKGIKRSSTSPMSSDSLFASPVEESPPSALTVDAKTSTDTRRNGQDSDANEKVDSGVGLGIDVSLPQQSKQKLSDEIVPVGIESNISGVDAISSSNIARTSHAERARESMAITPTNDTTNFLPQPLEAMNGLGRQHKHADHNGASEFPSSEPRTSLIDRTRQSISLAPQPSAQPKNKPTHARSRTSDYPVNQFDTPKKARRSSVGLVPQRKRDITPREQLFSPDAQYDSVFKSRPKIALSPILSPYVDSKRVSMESHGGLDMEDVERRSPSAAILAPH